MWQDEIKYEIKDKSKIKWKKILMNYSLDV